MAKAAAVSVALHAALFASAEWHGLGLRGPADKRPAIDTAPAIEVELVPAPPEPPPTPAVEPVSPPEVAVPTEPSVPTPIPEPAEVEAPALAATGAVVDHAEGPPSEQVAALPADWVVPPIPAEPEPVLQPEPVLPLPAVQPEQAPIQQPAQKPKAPPAVAPVEASPVEASSVELASGVTIDETLPPLVLDVSPVAESAPPARPEASDETAADERAGDEMDEVNGMAETVVRLEPNPGGSIDDIFVSPAEYQAILDAIMAHWPEGGGRPTVLRDDSVELRMILTYHGRIVSVEVMNTDALASRSEVHLRDALRLAQALRRVSSLPLDQSRTDVQKVLLWRFVVPWPGSDAVQHATRSKALQ